MAGSRRVPFEFHHRHRDHAALPPALLEQRDRDLEGFLGSLAFSGAFAHQTGLAQSVTQSTWTTVRQNTVEFDTDEFWNASNPARFTVKVPGYYAVGGFAELDAMSDAVGTLIGVWKNGAAMPGRARVPTSGAASDVGPFYVRPVRLEAGDYVDTRIYHEDSAAREIATSAIWIWRIGV